MKSVEEIQRKLTDVKSRPANFENDIIIGYLECALNHKEYWLHHLLNHYKFDIREDEIIVRTLEWILDEANNNEI